ncbi:metalloregulator ArsR/SmtB family transcription factor [Streptomyces sp. NPDC093252]|uniref:ArsR/SmtB family transcription factor n=1 Tax=Streptomyces sp. NPDC093252 TaxID=3154980 RepID=UPI003420A4B8
MSDDDALWAALADPHRRAIVALLLERPRSVGELVERTGLSQPGTSKHLKVLREAGLVRVRQDAQRRVYALDPAPIAALDAWLTPYRSLWNRSLDALGHRLDAAAGPADGTDPPGPPRAAPRSVGPHRSTPAPKD